MARGLIVIIIGYVLQFTAFYCWETEIGTILTVSRPILRNWKKAFIYSVIYSFIDISYKNDLTPIAEHRGTEPFNFQASSQLLHGKASVNDFYSDITVKSSFRPDGRCLKLGFSNQEFSTR